MLRIGVLAVFTVLSSITVALPAAQAVVPPVCADGLDEFHFTPPLDLLPGPTNFTGQGQSSSTCLQGTAPEGATEVRMISTSMGSGDLACTINTNVEGQMTFHWLMDTTHVVATTHVELTLMEIAGASKVVEYRGVVTSGALDGSFMLLTYISTADTQQCLPPNDGLEVVPGLVTKLTFTPSPLP